MENGRGRGGGLLNPDGNERLTAAVGLVLLVLTIAELGTNVLGLGQFLSVHVFVGLVLIPPVLLKLASTGWRFARYYTGSKPYTAKGAPELPMRLLAPLLGRRHGRPLRKRRCHGHLARARARHRSAAARACLCRLDDPRRRARSRLPQAGAHHQRRKTSRRLLFYRRSAAP